MIDRLQRDYERARQAAPYGDDAQVDRLTRQLVEAGHPILQSHKLADTDRGHVQALHNYFAPPLESHVLDVGCGVGAVAEIMAELRPDLRFTLLNVSPAQLALAPIGMARVAGHMHALPFATGKLDAVMFCFALGHGLVDRCLAEASRVLRPGGVLFGYELTADRPEELVDLMGYRPHRVGEVLAAGQRLGLVVSEVLTPPSSIADCLALFGQETFTRHGFDRAWPAIYRFVRPAAAAWRVRPFAPAP